MCRSAQETPILLWCSFSHRKGLSFAIVHKQSVKSWCSMRDERRRCTRARGVFRRRSSRRSCLQVKTTFSDHRRTAATYRTSSPYFRNPSSSRVQNAKNWSSCKGSTLLPGLRRLTKSNSIVPLFGTFQDMSKCMGCLSNLQFLHTRSIGSRFPVRFL